MDFRAEFSDAAIEEGTQTVHFVADRRRDRLWISPVCCAIVPALCQRPGIFNPSWLISG